MSRMHIMAAGLAVSTLSLGCDSWVENVDPPESVVTDDQLASEDQVDLLINGVVSEFSLVNSELALASGMLSDEFFFDARNFQSVTPSFRQIDDAVIPLDNGTISRIFDELGRLRFLADDLIRRVSGLQFEDQDLKRRAEYTGHFYGAIARFYHGGYYGLTEREGGGVITQDPADPAPFTPSDEMYRLALNKLDQALAIADAEKARIVRTISARIYLLLGEWSVARSAAQAGMSPGDPPFQSVHNATIPNRFWQQAGPNFTQLLADSAFRQDLDADPEESARIALFPILGRDSTTFYRQDRYTDRSDPISFSTWQENELILAELDLRDADAAGALAHMNSVRASHGLGNLTSIDMAVLEEERRKELWMMGLRLIDQRRFGSWHKGPGTWWNLPIPQRERDRNPHL